MFKNLEKKIKFLAKISPAAIVLLAVLSAVSYITKSLILDAVIALVGGLFSAAVVPYLLYGFAEIIEGVKGMNGGNSPAKDESCSTKPDYDSMANPVIDDFQLDMPEPPKNNGLKIKPKGGAYRLSIYTLKMLIGVPVIAFVLGAALYLVGNIEALTVNPDIITQLLTEALVPGIIFAAVGGVIYASISIKRTKNYTKLRNDLRKSKTVVVEGEAVYKHGNKTLVGWLFLRKYNILEFYTFDDGKMANPFSINLADITEVKSGLFSLTLKSQKGKHRLSVHRPGIWKHIIKVAKEGILDL